MFIFCKEELRRPSKYRSVVSYAPQLTSAGRTFPFCRDSRMYLYRMFRKLEETSRISSPTASIVQIKKLRSWVINPPKEEKFIKAGQETASLRTLPRHHTILWVPSPWLCVSLYNDYRILYNECVFSKTYLFLWVWVVCLHACLCSMWCSAKKDQKIESDTLGQETIGSCHMSTRNQTRVL